MCDTLFKKIGKNAIFLKNSDRSANEPNLIVYYPKRKAEGQIKCTYITVTDKDSLAVLLYKPSWIWGAEMGINEKGVTIGNEAVWTKSKGKKTERLLGMDLLRLALERGETAKDALQIIIDLLIEYGQGGNAGYDHPFYYDNSFLITDGKECYVLETAGKKWAWRKEEYQANISNRLSITDNYHESSEKGNFLKGNFEPIYSFFSGSQQRKTCGCYYLDRIKEFSLSDAFNTLRAHHNNADDHILFTKGSVKSVCMHAGGIGDHTTGSMAVFYIDNKPYIWVTGSSTPCLSVFKPIVFGKTQAPVFSNQEESLNYFMQREKVNRAIYANIIDATTHREKAKKLENEFIAKFLLVIKDANNDYENLCLECAKEEQKLYDSYANEVKLFKEGNGNLSSYWQKKNKNLGKNVFETDWRKKC